VHKLLRKEGLGLSGAERDRLLGEVADDMGYTDAEALLVAVGDGNVTAATPVGRVVRKVSPEEPLATEDLLAPPRRVRTEQPRPSRGVVVEGLDDVWVRIARCCAPVPGDAIVGFVTVGHGVSVHRADCTNIGALSDRSERIIDVAWDAGHSGAFTVWVQVEAFDRPRLLQDVTVRLSDLGVNIAASSSATDRDRVAILRYEVELSEPAQLDRLLTDLRTIEGVYDAYRLVPRGQD
jgi:GTP pyrophosphokinase